MALNRDSNGQLAAFAPLRNEVDARVNQILGKLDHIADSIVEASGRAMEQLAEEQYADFSNVANTATGTDVQVSFGSPLPGTAWLINAIAVTGGAAGPCAVYFDVVDSPGNLRLFIPNAQIFSKDGDSMLYVPSNRKLIFHFYSQPNNQVVSAAFQAKVLTQAPLVHAPYAGEFEQ